MQPLSIGIPATLNFSNASPINIRGIAILLVASHNAALAADAFGHVEMKTILLVGRERPLRNERGFLSEGCSTLMCASGTRCPSGRHPEVGVWLFRSVERGNNMASWQTLSLCGHDEVSGWDQTG